MVLLVTANSSLFYDANLQPETIEGDSCAVVCLLDDTSCGKVALLMAIF